jgi:hypothetical protein
VLEETSVFELACAFSIPVAACSSRGAKASGVCPLWTRRVMNLESMFVKSDGLF